MFYFVIIFAFINIKEIEKHQLECVLILFLKKWFTEARMRILRYLKDISVAVLTYLFMRLLKSGTKR